MHSTKTPKRRPSLMQLFRLRLGDRTNFELPSPAPIPSACEPKKRKEKEKKKKAEEEGDVDEAALVRAYGRAFVAEVALLQFMDGGSTAHNVQRALKKRGKLSAAAAEGMQSASDEPASEADFGRKQPPGSLTF